MNSNIVLAYHYKMYLNCDINRTNLPSSFIKSKKLLEHIHWSVHSFTKKLTLHIITLDIVYVTIHVRPLVFLPTHI